MKARLCSQMFVGVTSLTLLLAPRVTMAQAGEGLRAADSRYEPWVDFEGLGTRMPPALRLTAPRFLRDYDRRADPTMDSVNASAIRHTATKPSPTTRKEREVLLWTAIGAAAGAGMGFVATADVDCSHGENLCPVVRKGGAVFGGLVGFLIGLSR